jgi:hypothetical protein
MSELSSSEERDSTRIPADPRISEAALDQASDHCSDAVNKASGGSAEAQQMLTDHGGRNSLLDGACIGPLSKRRTLPGFTPASELAAGVCA